MYSCLAVHRNQPGHSHLQQPSGFHDTMMRQLLGSGSCTAHPGANAAPSARLLVSFIVGASNKSPLADASRGAISCQVDDGYLQVCKCTRPKVPARSLIMISASELIEPFVGCYPCQFCTSTRGSCLLQRHLAFSVLVPRPCPAFVAILYGFDFPDQTVLRLQRLRSLLPWS
jgi:hypothetical protein